MNENLDVRKASVYLDQDLSEKKFNDFRLDLNCNKKRSKNVFTKLDTYSCDNKINIIKSMH